MKNIKILFYSVFILLGLLTNLSAHSGGGNGGGNDSKQGPINVRGFTAEDYDFYYNHVNMLTAQELAAAMRDEKNIRFGHYSPQSNETRQLQAEAYLANTAGEVLSGGVFLINATGAIIGFIAVGAEVAIIGSISLAGDSLAAAAGSLAEDQGSSMGYWDRGVKSAYSGIKKTFWTMVGQDFIGGKNLSAGWNAFANFVFAQTTDNVSLAEMTEGDKNAK